MVGCRIGVVSNTDIEISRSILRGYSRAGPGIDISDRREESHWKDRKAWKARREGRKVRSTAFARRLQIQRGHVRGGSRGIETLRLGPLSQY